MMGIIISQANSTFRLLGLRSRLLCVILEKKHSSLLQAPSFHTFMGMIISEASSNLGPGLKVRVDMTEIFSIM